MRLRVLLLSIAWFAAVGPVHSADSQGAAGVRIIKSFLTDVRAAMGTRDPAKVRAVAERYMAEDYIQHASEFAPGREGFISTMTDALNKPPPAATPAPGEASPKGAPAMPKDLHFFGDGEFVVWVSESREPGKLVFNMVRIVDGKMKEHWGSN